MAAGYDELRPDVRESQEDSLEAVKSTNAKDARSVVRDLDGDDDPDGGIRGGELVDGELTVDLVPQDEDEFVRQSCHLVRHHSQIARVEGTRAYCADCEA